MKRLQCINKDSTQRSITGEPEYTWIEVKTKFGHRFNGAGIFYRKSGPAESVIVGSSKGPYKDKIGASTISYTGENPRRGRSTDQSITGGNLALVRTFIQSRDVKVIRRIAQNRYSLLGHFRVKSVAWANSGKQRVLRFSLVR